MQKRHYSNLNPSLIIPKEEHIPYITQLMKSRWDDFQEFSPEYWKIDQKTLTNYPDNLSNALKSEKALSLVHRTNSEVDGFILGRLVMPPEVYDAGLTLLIDDFSVRQNSWLSVGNELLQNIRSLASQRGAKQLIVITSYHDETQKRLMEAANLSVTSDWWVKKILSQKIKNFESSNIQIITPQDVDACVSLSQKKRLFYEKAQPLFWKMAHNADSFQKDYFLQQITSPQIIPLLYQENINSITGFIIGDVQSHLKVFNPGPICHVDDFAITNKELWSSIGQSLLDIMYVKAFEKGANYLKVVSGRHDTSKQKFLENYGSEVMINWWTGEIF